MKIDGVVACPFYKCLLARGAAAIIRNRVGEEVSGRAVPRGEHQAIFSNILKHSADFLRSLTDCRVRGRDDVRVPPPPHAFWIFAFPRGGGGG